MKTFHHAHLRRRRRTIAYVGTYPPKQCGIATFTLDLVSSTDLCGWQSVILPVEDETAAASHPDSKVIKVIEKESTASYAAAAQCIRESRADLLSIQHEYGIYGGDCGEHILRLVREVTCPSVVTLHTILPEPSAGQKRIIRDLERYCNGFVTMARAGERLLRDVYGVASSKIHFVPHGAPNISFDGGEQLKARYGLSGRRVLSTFGLIGPSKGIEDAIAAMVSIVANEPRAIYLVLGETHPVLKRREGEWYRQKLIQQVEDLGLKDNVRFVDEYLTLPQLIDYLRLTDIYITPYYANPHQITSGTLAYALAAGKVIVSTPYIYAQELLAGGRGFLYPFRDSEALAGIVSELLGDNALFESVRRRAYQRGRTMTWQSVGLEYARLFTGVLREQWVEDQVAADTALMANMGGIWEMARSRVRSKPAKTLSSAARSL
jgi:glycosyltransferase involved in cell wall biosynthesis